MAMPSSAHKETVEGIAAPSKGSCVQQGTAEAEAISPEVLECAARSDRVIVICGLMLEHIPWQEVVEPRGSWEQHQAGAYPRGRDNQENLHLCPAEATGRLSRIDQLSSGDALNA